ncbi:RcnB family protein [Phenylobacterium sp.]|uniref:RcnB family protein n=1 Tax=Phenylobacterium sp. TaxID=1871053 RepID=UPI0035AD9A9B
MKKVITTALLAALLASSAAEALAQDADRGWNGGQRTRSSGSPDRPNGEARAYRAAPAAAPQQQPQQQQQQQQRSGEVRRAGPAGVLVRPDSRPPPPPQTAPQPPRAPTPRPAPRPPSADNHQNWNGGGDRHDWNNRPGDGRPGDDRYDNDRGDRDRYSGDHDWNRDRDRYQPYWNDSHRPNDRDRPRYDRRYYPPIYQTPRRYHVTPYRPPAGWYAYGWSFGDILPRAWYGPNYFIDDWWAYGLPIPPFGYEWVRVGDDALLVDTYTGRVVQVVYDLFW